MKGKMNRLFGSNSEQSDSSRVPIFVNLPDGREFGPLFLPAVPRLGEIIEGGWLGLEPEEEEKENEDYSGYFEVSRVFHCKSDDSLPRPLSDKPHIYLYLNPLDQWELPPLSQDLLWEIRKHRRAGPDNTISE